VHYDARALGEAGLRQPDECGLLRIVGQHRFRDWLFGAKLKVCGGKKRLLERRRSCSIDGRECSTQRCHVDQGEILGLEIVERGRCDLLNRRWLGRRNGNDWARRGARRLLLLLLLRAVAEKAIE